MTKTKYLVGAFVATALLMGGCGDEETAEVPAQNQTQSLAGQRLTDDNGVEYTLIDNGDGTETARYDDGRSVTFRRQEDGSLDFLSGTAGLIAGMAAGYFLFHGFSSPAGTWNSTTNRYTVSEPLQRRSTPTSAASTANTAKPSTPSSNATSSNTNSTAANSANSNSKVNLSKDSSSSTNSSAKSGFGTAGARGGSSSAAS